VPRSEWLWVPPSLLSNGYQRLLPWEWSGQGMKLTAHLHPVLRSKNEWSYASTPPYAFMAWCLVKAQGQLYLYLYLCLGLLSDPCVTFLNKLFLWWVVSPLPSPKLEDHPLSAVCDCLFNIFTTSLHIWRLSLPCKTWGCAMLWWQGPPQHGI
jgi:hypothetical protein